MKRNRWLTMGVVFALLVILVYIQFRTLRSFQWPVLAQAFDSIRWMHIVLGTALIYGAYVTRAFRWSVFLRSTRPAPGANGSRAIYRLYLRCGARPSGRIC